MLLKIHNNSNIEKHLGVEPLGTLRERYAQCVREQGILQGHIK
jgi:hypothetical protein